MDNNTTVLAFDTCLDKMYVSLKKNENFLASEIVENTDTKYHSAFLISTIKKVLRDNGISPQEIDLIAINIGPGSFTGIRACTTVARVMAQQLNIKAVGVSSLEILSEINKINKINKDNQSSKKPLVALDARKNSAYLYYDGEIKGASQLEIIKEIINSGEYDVITDNKLLPILGGISYQDTKLFENGKSNRALPLGEILTDLALKKIKRVDGDWGKLLPLYIQPPPMG